MDEIRYQCGKLRGDCTIGKRDNENFCHHKKYCSSKIPFGTKKIEIFIKDNPFIEHDKDD